MARANQAANLLRGPFLASARTKEPAIIKWRKYVAQPRSGQLLSVKAIAYLALVIICIVLAVALLAKLWNAFVGTSPADQDVGMLRTVMYDMLKQDDPYLQVPIVLRLDGERIVGFSKGEASVSLAQITSGVSTGKDGLTTTSKTITINRGNCGDDACLCTSDGTSAHGCVRLAPPNGIEAIYLYTNYLDYGDNVLATNMFVPPEWNALPAGIKGDASAFIIDATQVRAFRIVDRSQPSDGPTPVATVRSENAIIPLIIEKQVTQGPNGKYAVFTVLPDTDAARARAYYLQICSDENTGSERPKIDCAGKTFMNSIVTGPGEPHACTPRSFSTTCSYEPIPACENNQRVTGPCVCGGETIFSGMCASNTPYPVVCDLVTTCESYCLQDGNPDCTSIEENVLCPADPCRVSPSGSICKQRKGNEEGWWDRLWPDAKNRLCMTAPI